MVAAAVKYPVLALSLALAVLGQDDPCVKIAGKAFVPPADALACEKSFPFNETLRQNILAVTNGVFDFYTFEDYYYNSPPPFEESTVDIRGEFARINSTTYETDYDFQWDLYTVTTRLNDGHSRYYPDCYVSFQNMLPAPVISLEVNGTEAVYVAPNSVEFLALLGDEFTGYFDSIGFDYKRLAGAKVLEMGGIPAYDYIDKIASTVSGNYLDHGVRVNSVYTSYRVVSDPGFSQRLGDLAGPNGVVDTSLKFKLIVANSTVEEEIDVPYLANYIGYNFTTGEEFWQKNCLANDLTNGVDLKSGTNSAKRASRKQPIGEFIEAKANATIIGMPDANKPNLTTTAGSGDIIKGYILPGNSTGVMMVGSFSPLSFDGFQSDVVSAITEMKAAGVTQLILDLTDNGGGYVCLGQFLHKYLASSKIGNPGFVSTLRANELARKIVASDIALGLDASLAFYTPDNYAFLNNSQQPVDYNYIEPPLNSTINGREYQESQRYFDTCESTFTQDIPDEPPFDLNNVVIVGNSWCASTCAMFTTLMFEHYGTKIASFGAKPGETTEYKGMAGNQVLEWADLDTEIKTANMKNDSLAPPDFLVSSRMRINWRTAYSWIDDKIPIEYRSEPAKYRFPYTPETYMNPQNLWVFAESQLFNASSNSTTARPKRWSPLTDPS